MKTQPCWQGGPEDSRSKGILQVCLASAGAGSSPCPCTSPSKSATAQRPGSSSVGEGFIGDTIIPVVKLGRGNEGGLLCPALPCPLIKETHSLPHSDCHLSWTNVCISMLWLHGQPCGRRSLNAPGLEGPQMAGGSLHEFMFFYGVLRAPYQLAV